MILHTPPLEHQTPWLDRAVSAFQKYGGFGALCEMGTGKSWTTIAAFKHLYDAGLTNAILIIAPGMACDTWQNDELSKHTDLTKDDTFRWDSGKAKPPKAPKFDKYKAAYKEFIASKPVPIFVVNVEAFQNRNADLPRYLGYFYSQRKVFCIVDESSSIKSILAERSKEVIEYTRKAIFRTILTGTEISKSLTDIHPQMEFLVSDFWLPHLGLPAGTPLKSQYYAFRHKFCIMDKRYVSETRQIDKEFSWTDLREEKAMIEGKIAAARASGRHADALTWEYKLKWTTDAMVQYNRNLDRVNAIIAPYVYRIRKADTNLNLPPKMFSTLKVHMTPEEGRIYQELSDELMTMANDGQIFSYQTRLVLFTKFRQITGGWLEDYQIEKIPSKLAALLSDLADTDEQAIIWCNYTNELEMVYKALAPLGGCSRYYGKIRPEDRDGEKLAFVQGRNRFIVINPMAGAYSMNLQNCTLQYWYDRPTQLQRYLQGLDRSHRIGVKNTCVYKDLVSIGTVDERVNRLLDDSLDVFERFKNFDMRTFLGLVQRGTK